MSEGAESFKIMIKIVLKVIEKALELKGGTCSKLMIKIVIKTIHRSEAHLRPSPQMSKIEHFVTIVNCF